MNPFALSFLLAGSAWAQAREESEESDEVSDEELTVTASAPVGTDPRSTSGNVTVIALDGRQSAGADVASVLDGVAGTTVTTLGGLGDWATVSIRGSSSRQVQVFLDGVPLNPDGGEAVNLSELPLSAFERVEVWRGLAPARYAAAPIGGVVDLITRSEPSTSLSATGGSHQTGRLVGVVGRRRGLGQGQLDGLAMADLFTTSGDYRYFDDNGTTYSVIDDQLVRRDNNDKRQGSGIARLRWSKGRLRLGVQDGFLAREEGLPGHVQAPSLSARLWTWRNLLSLSAEGGGERTKLESRAWLLQRQERLDDAQGELGVGATEQRDAFTTVGLVGQGTWVPSAAVVAGATVQGRHEQYVRTDLASDASADSGGVSDAPRRREALSSALSLDLRGAGDRLLVSPVLQATLLHDRDSVEGPVTSLLGSPRLGLAVRPLPSLVLKTNLMRSVRPPDLTELYGDRGSMKGNPELLPERGTAADLGARLVGERGTLSGSLDLAGFWARTEDAIVVVQNSQRTSFPVNFGLTRSIGLESAATADAWERLDLRAALTWTDARNLSADASVNGNRLPRIPVVQTSLESGLRHGDRVRLGHAWTWSSGTFQDATNFYALAPRSLHSAFLRLQPGPAWPSAELSVLNLADRLVEVVPRNPLDDGDEARVVSAITDFAGYPLPGRTVLFTLRWESR